MNIFVLDPLPHAAARQHCDKHVVKMILEYAQLLSAAHRLLDGTMKVCEAPNGRKFKKYLLPGERTHMITKQLPIEQQPVAERPFGKKKNPYSFKIENPTAYDLSHPGHPCTKWVCASDANYHWLKQLFQALLEEYTARYGKVHKTARMLPFLTNAPKNIPRGQQTPFVQAMPDAFKTEDAVEAYHRLYIEAKSRFAKWTNTELPKWFERAMEGKDVAIFRRTRTVD